LGADGVDAVARAAGMSKRWVHETGGRWFAEVAA
jgi:hypothetical protein